MNYTSKKNKAVDTTSMKFSTGGRVYLTSRRTQKDRVKRANEILKTISRMKVAK